MRNTPSFAVALLISLASYDDAVAQVEIDLASDPAHVTIWGSEGDDWTGRTIAIGDLNGDGFLDLVFEEEGRKISASDSGRACVYFGPFPTPLERDLLTETPPLCIEAFDASEEFGARVHLGDLDGDGLSDLIVGIDNGGPRVGAGAVSIFRGRAVWPSVLTLSDADWSFFGADEDDFLRSVVVGDLNGDGSPDLALFSSDADGPGDTRDGAGEGYIFFGPTSAWTKAVYDLRFDEPDVIIYGADGEQDNPPPNDGDAFGAFGRVRIADVVGDAIPDLVVAAPFAAGPLNSAYHTGEVYVLRGRSVWPSMLDMRFSAPDLLVYGPTGGAMDAVAVTDWDGDGNEDLILGAKAYTHPSFGRVDAGALFILRGRTALTGMWDLAVRLPDATIVGPRASSFLGVTIEVGDVNGDGYSDIVSSSFDPTPFARTFAGTVFVISGCDGYEPLRDLAAKPAEMAVYGASASDLFGGYSLAVGDVDGDGRTDLFAGAVGSQSKGNSRGRRAGEAHLILGRSFSPVCTITPDAGAGADICGTAIDVTLDGSLTVVVNCSVTPQYRWMDGTTIVRDWSTDPTVVVRPTQTTVYRLEVRCGDCAGPCFDSAEVVVTVEPDIIPPDLENTLRAVRRGIVDVELTWDPVTEAKSYSLYRATAKETWPPVFLENLPMTQSTLPDQPFPPTLYFYRAAGASCSGAEGP